MPWDVCTDICVCMSFCVWFVCACVWHGALVYVFYSGSTASFYSDAVTTMMLRFPIKRKRQ